MRLESEVGEPAMVKEGRATARLHAREHHGHRSSEKMAQAGCGVKNE